MSTFFKPSFRVEALESRILLSAAPLDEGAGEEASQQVEFDLPRLEIEERAVEESGADTESIEQTDLYDSAVPLNDGGFTAQGVGTSADTLSEGESLFFNHSIVIESGAYSETLDLDEAVLIDTTNGGDPEFLEGADITITGSVAGTTGDQMLYVNAGTEGTIRIQGTIGVEEVLKRMVVINAKDVRLDSEVRLTDFVQEAGTGSTSFGTQNDGGDLILENDLTIDTANNITFHGALESEAGSVSLKTSSGKILVRGNTTLEEGDFLIRSARDVEFRRSIEIAGDFVQEVGTNRTEFERNVRAASIEIHADDGIRFRGTVQALEGDILLVGDEIDFDGPSGSVSGASVDGAAVTHLVMRPTSPEVPIDIGSPGGGGSGTRLDLATSDLSALSDGFASITIGYTEEAIDDLGFTGTAADDIRIGSSTFRDSTSIYGRSITVTGNTNGHTSLLLDARTGGIEVGGSQVRVSNEQVGSTWQSSELTLLAHDGDILLRDGASLRITNHDNSAPAQGSEIFLTASNGSIINQTGSLGRVIARDLDVVADGQIAIRTNVENLTVASTREGSLAVDELDGVHVISATTADGPISFVTGGNTELTRVESETDDAANDISIQVFNGETEVSEVIAGAQADIEIEAESGPVIGLDNGGNPHFVAATLTITGVGGIGESDNPIRLNVSRVEALNLSSGPVSLVESHNDSTVQAAIENRAGGTTGHVTLIVEGAAIEVLEDGITSASDAGVLLKGEALFIDGPVSTDDGPITLTAVNEVELRSEVEVSSAGGDIVITGTELTMDASAVIASGGGQISLVATDDSVVLGTVDARSGSSDQTTWGQVAIHAEGAIVAEEVDADSSNWANIYASGLILRAGSGIGALPDSGNERTLVVNARTLAATTSDGAIVIHDIAGLNTGTVDGFTPDIAKADGTVEKGDSAAGLSAIFHSGGGDVVLSAEEHLILSAADAESDAVATDGTGRLALVADAITVNGNLDSKGGAISLSANGDIEIEESADVRTTGAASIALSSASGWVDFFAGSELSTDTGSVVIVAAAGMALGAVSTSGSVGLRSSSGGIRTSTGGVNDRTVVNAGSLTIDVDGAVSGPDDTSLALSTDVGSLSFSASNGSEHRLRNQGDLVIETTSASATRSDRFLGESDLETPSQDNVTVTGGGNVEIVLIEGNLTLSEAAGEVSLDGGNLVLEASRMELNADVSVAGGDVTLTAFADIDLAANRSITTTDEGDISLETEAGFVMGSGSRVESQEGTIDISSEDDVVVARILSESGTITVVSENGAIIDADPQQTAADFETTGHISLKASTGIGIDGVDRETLTVLAGSLDASTETGGIFLVSPASLTTTGLVTSGSNAPVVVESGDSLTLSPDPDDSSGSAVEVAGNLVLTAATDLTIAGAVTPVSGSISFTATGGDLTLIEGIHLSVTESFTATAGGAIRQNAGGSIVAGGDISLSAGSDLGIARIETEGNVVVNAASITDRSTSSDPRIEAIGLLLDEIGSVVSVTEPLLISVERLAGDVTGGTLAIDNDRDLVLGPVSVTTSPVDSESGALSDDVTVSADALVISGEGDGVFVDVAGTLTVEKLDEPTLTVGANGAPTLLETSDDQIWNGTFELSGGLLTLRTGGNLEIDAAGTLAGGGGDIYVDVAGEWLLKKDSLLDLDGASLMAAVAGDIIFDGVVYGATDIALLSDSGVIAPSQEAEATHLTGENLILRSSLSLGAIDMPLTTAVDRLTAHGGPQGIHLHNDGDLRITNGGFAIASIVRGGSLEVAFSGHHGGVKTTMAGPINLDIDGALIVDPVAAAIIAFPDGPQHLSLVADEAGVAGNDISVSFEEPAEQGDGGPPTTEWNEDGLQLTVWLRIGEVTWGEVVDAINANPDFPATAVLATGAFDGSTLFAPDPNDEFVAVTEGGMEEGILTTAAARFGGGEEPTPGTASLELPDRFYGIRFTASNPGVAANGTEVRLLDDGPGGRLANGADEAEVEWNEASGTLDLFVNFGATTIATLFDALHESDAPFEAELSGSFDSSTLAETLGDPSVLLESDLNASTILRPIGNNNNMELVAVEHGSRYNGIQVVMIDDASVEEDGVRAAFSGTNNVLSVYISSDETTANEIVAAINDQGTFTASLYTGDGSNSGNGTVQAHRFMTTGGATENKATAKVTLSGPANDFILTAVDAGADFNGIRVVFVNDETLESGTAKADYSDSNKRLRITVNSMFTAAGFVVEAINEGPNASTIPFTAELAPGSSGLGPVSLWEAEPTSGGVSGPARATFTAAGSQNDFFIVADTDSPGLQNVRVYLIDDGTLTDGAATALFSNTARHLVINVESGVTTAETVLEAINQGPNSDSIPYTASLIEDNDGTGVYNMLPREISGGTDPVPATATTVLPSGATIVVEAEVLDFLPGGVPSNGIEVSFAIDPELESGTASASYVETDASRLLQLRGADADTTISQLAAALEAAELPFQVLNLDSVGDQTVGQLAVTSPDRVEGRIEIEAAGDISLIGSIVSETGGLGLTTTQSDLTFDSPVSRIEVFNQADLNVAGSIANLGSTMEQTITVLGTGGLTLSTGSAAISSEEDLSLFSGGNLSIQQAGLAANDASILVSAGGVVTIAGPLTVTIDEDETARLQVNAEGAIVVEAALVAPEILLVSEADIVLDGPVSADGSIEITAVDRIDQSAILAATGAADVTLEASDGPIVMSGDAMTTTESGSIHYTATDNIALTRLVSFDSGSIVVVSGSMITDSAPGDLQANLATGGGVRLESESGIGDFGASDIRTEVGSLVLRNFDSGNIVVTELDGGDMVVDELTNEADAGWSVIRTEGGNIRLVGPVTHSGDGPLVVHAERSQGSDLASATVFVEDTIFLGGGELLLRADESIHLAADVETDGGDISLHAADGVIHMEPAVTVDAGGGNIGFASEGDIRLSQVRSDSGVVGLTAIAGSILRSEPESGSPLGRTNVIADDLMLLAAGSVGSLDNAADALITEVNQLAVSAGSGGIALIENTSLILGEVELDVRVPQVDGSIVEVDSSLSGLLSSVGASVIQVGEAFHGVESIMSNGNLRISSGNSLTLDGTIQVGDGAIHLISGSTLSLSSAVSTQGGSFLAESSGLFHQDSASVISTGGGDVIIGSQSGITVSRIETGSGDIGLTAAGSILAESSAAEVHLVASGVRLSSNGSIGSVGEPVRVDADRLAARAPGSVRIDSAGDIALDSVEAFAARVSVLGETSTETLRHEAPLADLTSSAGGNLLLTVDGRLTLNDGNGNGLAVAANQTGHVFIEAQTLEAFADIRTVSGHITLEVAGNATWNEVDGTAAEVRSQGGSIHVTSGGSIEMADETFFRTTAGNLRVSAASDILVSSLRAPAGLLSLDSGGAIVGNGDAELDLVATELHVISANGLGLLNSFAPLTSQVGRMAVQIDSGPFALAETAGLEIGGVSGAVANVSVDGETSETVLEDLFGLVSKGGDSVSVTTQGTLSLLSSGSVTDDQMVVSVADTGNLYLHAEGSGSNLTVADRVEAGGGHLTLLARGDIEFAAGVPVVTSGDGSITVESEAGGITQESEALLQADGGDIAVSASGSVRLAGILSNAAAAVTSISGSILDNDSGNLNVSTATLRLQAAGAIGESDNALEISVGTLSALASGGGLYLLQAGDLIVGETSAETFQVLPDGTNEAAPVESQSDLTTGGNGNIVLRTVDGNLILTEGGNSNQRAVSAHGTGRILLEAGGNNDLRIESNVRSGSGHISLRAGVNLELAEAVTVTTSSGGHIDVEAESGTLAGEADSRFVAQNGNVRLAAASDIVLGGLTTGGLASLVSENGSILRAGSTAFSEDVVAGQLRLEAAGRIGELGADDADPLQTRVARVAAIAAGGGINLLESSSVRVDPVSVTVQRVEANGTLSAIDDSSLSNLTTTAANGDIVLRTLAGSITLGSDGEVSAHGSGNILLRAQGDNRSFTASSDVRTESGDISILATGTITLGDNVRVETGEAGDIALMTTGGAYQANQTSRVVSEEGNIHVSAEGNLMVGGFTTAGDVDLISVGGAILDAGDAGGADIIADNLRLFAAGSIGWGTAIDALETDVSTVAAISETGRVALTNLSGITIDRIESFEIRQVDADGESSPVTFGSISGVEAANTIILRVLSGDLLVGDGTGSGVRSLDEGDVLLAAEDSAGNVELRASVESADGHVTVSAGHALTLTGAVSIGAGEEGTVLAEALGGSIDLAPAASVNAENGSIRLFAADDIVLGRIETGGYVSLIADTGSVLNGGVAGDSENVSAARLVIRAADSVGVLGTDADSLTIAVNRLAATAGTGGINIAETDGLRIDSVSVRVDRVLDDATSERVDDALIANLNTSDDGSIVLSVLSGTLVLNASGEAYAVRAAGEGNILLDVESESGDLDVIRSIRSDLGHVSLMAGQSIFIRFGVEIETSGTGSHYLEAGSGNIEAHDNSRIRAEDGDVVVVATQTVIVGGITTDGRVAIEASEGSILNAGSEIGGPAVIAESLRLLAGTGIGVLGEETQHLDISVDTVAAQSLNGPIALTESDALVIGATSAEVAKVLATAATEVLSVSEMHSLTATGGAIVVQVSEGDLTVEPGPSQTPGVRATGAGNILLETQGADADVLLNGRVLSGGGHVTVLSADSIDLFAAARVETGSNGTINLDAAEGSVVMADGTQVIAASNDIRIRAAVDVLLGGVRSDANVAITAASGSILDNGDAHVDVIASGLRFVAGDSIGTLGWGANPINTDVDTLSARSGEGGINILERDRIHVDDVGVTVLEVASDGSDSAVVEETQSDLRTTGSGSIVLRLNSGSVTLNRGTSPDGNASVVADGSGDILIQTLGLLRNIDVLGDVISETGNISLLATLQVTIGTAANPVVVETEGDGTIDIRAPGEGITMGDGSSILSEDGDVRLHARGDVVLGEIRTLANVSLISDNGAIFDGDSGETNIEAENLRMFAYEGIGVLGAGVNPIGTRVSQLTAHVAEGSINILEASSVTVGDVAVSINRVTETAATTEVADAAQSDLRTHGEGGSIVLRSISGHITLQGGSASPDTAVSADGEGSILIEAIGFATSVVSHAGIVSELGPISILAAEDVIFEGAANVETKGGGSISVSAADGSVEQADGLRLTAENGDIRLFAGDSILVSGITTLENASLIAESGSILDNRTAAIDENVIADSLRLEAGASVGTADLPINTFVDTLSARAGSGGIYLLEAESLTVDAVGATVEQVTEDGTSETVTDPAQSDLRVTGGNGSIILVAGGALILNDGDGNVESVVAVGDGSVELTTLNGSDMIVNAAIDSGTGGATLTSDRDLLVSETSLNIGDTLTVNVTRDVVIVGSVAVGDWSDWTIGGDFQLTGDYTGGNDVAFDVEGTTTIDGSLFVENDFTLRGTGAIEIRAIEIRGIDEVSVSDGVNIRGEDTVLLTGALIAGGDLTLEAADGLTMNGDISSGGDGALRVGGDDIVDAGPFVLTGTLDIAGTLTLVADGDVTWTGTFEVGQTSSLTVEGDLAVGGVYVVGADSTNVVGGATTLVARITVAEQFSLDGGGSIIMRDEITVGGAVIVNSGEALTLTGDLAAGESLAMDSVEAMTLNGMLTSEGDANIGSGGTFALSGTLIAGGALDIESSGTATFGTTVTAEERIAVVVTAGSLSMSDTTLFTSNLATIYLEAVNSVTIGGLLAPEGVSVTAGTGAILSAGQSHRSIETLTSVEVSAATGIGRTGSGSLTVQASDIEFVNTVSGSVYLRVEENITLGGGVLNGGGSLHLTVSGGALNLTGAVEAPGGAVVLRVDGDLTLDSGVLAERDVRLDAAALLVSSSFDLSLPLLRSEDGNVQARIAGAVTLPAGGRIEAPNGAVRMQAGGTMVIGVIEAASLIDLRAGGDVLSAGMPRVEHELRARAIQLFAGGDLGAEGQPILSDTERLDFQAGGYAEVFEIDDLEIGRYGLRLEDGQPGDELVLLMGEGTLTGAGDLAVIPGAGDFILRSSEVVTLSTQLLSPEGNILIDTFGLNVGEGLADALVSAPEGSLVLLVGEGELGPGLTVTADTFESAIESGDLRVGMFGTTRIGPTGLKLADGNGVIELEVTDGDLDVSGALVATGGIDIRATSGGLNVLADAPSGVLFNADEASVAIELETGVTSGAGERVEVLAGEFSALTETGDLTFGLNGPLTKIADPGIRIQGGSGTIDLRAPTGNIQTFGDIRHEGSGDVGIRVADGSFVMEAGSQLRVGQGNLDMNVRNLIMISEVFNLLGTTNIVSTHSSILRQTEMSSGVPNLMLGDTPVFSMSGTISLLLDADEAIVNGKFVERSPTDTYLLLSGTFR